MREGVRVRNGFWYVNRWAGRGEDQGRYTRNQHQGWFGDGSTKEGERYEDTMKDDQKGWQRVQHRRSRNQGPREGWRKVYFAPQSSKAQGDEKNVTSFFFTNFPLSYTASDVYYAFFKAWKGFRSVHPDEDGLSKEVWFCKIS